MAENNPIFVTPSWDDQRRSFLWSKFVAVDVTSKRGMESYDNISCINV